jgi:flagellin
LTTKIETVQERLNVARVQAGSQYAALEEAINVSTDLRSQFAQASGTLSDLNFSMETVNLTRRQMQQDVATSVLTQANKTQSSLVSLVDGSYRTYLNAQFSHLK